MKIITERDNIKSWFELYKNDDREPMEEARKLDPETCSAEEIAEIMIKHRLWNRGCQNDREKTWFIHTCDECGKPSPVLLQVGNEPDYDSRTAYLCLDCLKKAAEFAGFAVGVKLEAVK